MFKDVDWGAKLSSRKFWSLIAGFVAGLLVLFRVSENTVIQAVAAIGSFGSIMVYILAEAYIDAKNVESKRER